MLMEALHKSMPSQQFCPLCAKKGKKTKILSVPINLSAAVKMCISVKCTYPFGEYVITELPPPSGQELSTIIQEVSEENKGITDEDIISSVENRQILNMDENISFPYIDDSFILQQLNQHLDSGISEYPNTNHLVDNETLVCDTSHLLNGNKEEISISTEFDELLQKPIDQKSTVDVNMLCKDIAIQNIDTEISEFSNTNHLVDSETLPCDVEHLLDNTIEENSISTEAHQPTQKTAVAVSMRKKRKPHVLTPQYNIFQVNGEPGFLNKITEHYMGNVSNLPDFTNSSKETTSESGETDQKKLEGIAMADDDVPNNITFAESTEENVEPTEKVVESLANIVQSITEIVQPIEKVVQPITEIVQPTVEGVQLIEMVSQPFSIQNIERAVEPIEKVVQSLERVVMTKAKAAQLKGKVDILKKKKKCQSKSNLDTPVEESNSDLEIVEMPEKEPNKKYESNLKLLSLSRRHTVLKRSSTRMSGLPTRFL